MARNPLDGPQQDPDPLTYNGAEAGVWSLPSNPLGDVPAALPPEQHDYSHGVFTDTDQGLGFAGGSPHMLQLKTDLANTYQTPHEATHRRYEPPKSFPVSQLAAGYTQIAPTLLGLHFIKLIACSLLLDAAGTLKFVQGPNDGSGISAANGGGDLSGLMPFGTNGGFVLSPARVETPWFFTAPDQALGIFTVTGKAFGFVTVVYSPYDQ